MISESYYLVEGFNYEPLMKKLNWLRLEGSRSSETKELALISYNSINKHKAKQPLRILKQTKLKIDTFLNQPSTSLFLVISERIQITFLQNQQYKRQSLPNFQSFSLTSQLKKLSNISFSCFASLTSTIKVVSCVLKLEVKGKFDRMVIILCKMEGRREVQLMSRLGEGAYGCVYKGKYTKSDQLVAVKVIRINADDEGISSTTLREITILKNLNHNNIIKLLEYRVDYESFDPKVELVFEYMEEDLAKRIKTVKKFSAANTKNIMRQILEGVSYMHSKGVFHRDLKPQNILINSSGLVKIADFGLGRIVGKRLQTMSKEIQTLWYRAPQLLLGTVHYDLSVDMWSLGCIFYEVAEGEVLFQTESQIGQIFEIMKQCGTPKQAEWEKIVHLPNFKPTFPKFEKPQRTYNSLNPQGIDLFERMIQLNPSRRISITDALLHPYFSS